MPAHQEQMLDPGKQSPAEVPPTNGHDPAHVDVERPSDPPSVGDPDFPTSDQRPEAGAPIQKKYKRGQFDPLGDGIFKVFVSTDFFIIYTASDETGGDVGRQRYILPDNYEDAKKYRTCLGAHRQTTRVRRRCDRKHATGPVHHPARPHAGFDGAIRSWPSRANTSARSSSLNAQAKSPIAVTAESDALYFRQRDFADCDPVRRVLDRGGFNVHNLSTLFSGPTRAGGLPDGTFRVVDVLAFGALGAFFAVSADIKSVKINHSISIWEMLYAGFVRVPIGVIAAAVVILMISGGCDPRRGGC